MTMLTSTLGVGDCHAGQMTDMEKYMSYVLTRGLPEVGCWRSLQIRNWEERKKKLKSWMCVPDYNRKKLKKRK